MYVLSYRGLVAEKSVKLTIQCKLCVNETNGTIKVPMVKVNPLVFVTGNFGLFLQLQLYCKTPYIKHHVDTQGEG